MYRRFYKFTRKPFLTVSDGFCFFKNGQFSEAYNHLLYAIREKEGFLLITGEAGTGKSTLCHAVLKRLGDRVNGTVITQPPSTPAELLAAVLDAFGVQADGAGVKHMRDALNRFLITTRSSGKTAVVVMDEAQRLPVDVLEEIRCLSNMESSSEKLLQIVLCGQPELLDTVSAPDMAQLLQRIAVQYYLKPLPGNDVAAYIKYRILSAGPSPSVRFTREASLAVGRYSGGIPRLINHLCDKSLLAGYVAQTHIITPELVKEAAQSICCLQEKKNGKTAAAGIVYKIGVGAGGVAAVAVLFNIAAAFMNMDIDILGRKAPSDIGYAMVKEPENFRFRAEKKEVLPSGSREDDSSRLKPQRIIESNRAASSAMQVPCDERASLHRSGGGRNGPHPVRIVGGLFDQNNVVRTDENVQCAHEALGTLLYLWGMPKKTIAGHVASWKSKNKFSFYDAAQQAGFTVYSITGNLDTMVSLDYPCIVPLDEDRYRYTVLSKINENRITVLDPARGKRILAADDFKNLWTGRIFYPVKNKNAFPVVLKPGDRHESVSAIKLAFADAGYTITKPVTSQYNAELEAAVKKLQKTAHILEDGIFGGLTKMAYYRYVSNTLLPSISAGNRTGNEARDHAALSSGRGAGEALVMLLDIWGVNEQDLKRIAESFSGGDTFTMHASGCGFSISRKKISLAEIKKTDYPCIAVIRDPHDRFVVVKSITADEVQILDPVKGPRKIAVKTFLKQSRDDVFYAWKNIDGVPLGLKAGVEHPALSGIKRRLAKLGFSVNRIHSNSFTNELASAVRRFQITNNLDPDGIIGSRTLMTLYKKSYPGLIPSLQNTFFEKAACKQSFNKGHI